ncbi:MAG: hypothetical protein AAB152_03800 [Candidatus Coatesbacteria bacterium]
MRTIPAPTRSACWWPAFVLAVTLAGCAEGPLTGRSGPYRPPLLEPPFGRVLHGWGQLSSWWNQDDPAAVNDLTDLDTYISAVMPNQPALISFYLAPLENQVSAFLPKYAAFVKERPFFIAQIGLYFLDQPLQGQVASGEADAQLRRLFEGLKAAGRPVLLRIGHEFNQHEAPYDPKLYVQAFRRVATLAREVAPGLIATVWHAEPAGFADRDYHDWDPGDEYVDWWGLSLFFTEHMTATRTMDFLNDAAIRRKPALIAECSPWFHGDTAAPVRGPESLEEARSWYDALFKLTAAHPQIKGLSIIVVDWSRWNLKFSQIPGGLPDVRFDRWASLKEYYARTIADPRFIHSQEARRLYTAP